MIDDNLNVFFLEINTSPVVQKRYPKEVYFSVYDVAINKNHQNIMIYLNDDYLKLEEPTPTKTYDSKIHHDISSYTKHTIYDDLHKVGTDLDIHTPHITTATAIIHNKIDHMFIIKNIVNAVVKKEFTKEKLIQHNLGSTIFDAEELDDYTTTDTTATTDFKVQYKSISTNLITDVFLESSSKLINYIYLITALFDIAIKEYCKIRGLKDDQIIFIFKGGLALSLLYKKYLYEMPGIISEMMHKLFSSYFKRSDADFEILIDPSIENYDDVMVDITNLSYLLLNKLRNIFLISLDSYFDFYKFNLKNQTCILYETLKKMQNEAIKETIKESPFYEAEFESVEFDNKIICQNMPILMYPMTISGYANYLMNTESMIENRNHIEKYDFVVTQKSPDAKDNVMYDVNKLYLHPSFKTLDSLGYDTYLEQFLYCVKRDIYLSYNDSLKFILNTKLFKFNLIRMKMNFAYTYNKKGKQHNVSIPGEMIDVSIPDRVAFGVKELYENRKNYVHTIMFENTHENAQNLLSEKFPLTMFTVEYFCKDLENMLFYKYMFPWKLEKYTKRLTRLLFLYCTDLLKTLNDITQTKLYIEQMISAYSIENGLRQTAHRSRIDQLLKSKDFDKSKCSCMLINSLHELTIHLLDNNQKIIEDSNYVEYVGIITKFCKDMLDIYDTLDMTVNINKLNITETRMNTINIMGGYRKYNTIPFEKFV
jgi:hypothetical protein